MTRPQHEQGVGTVASALVIAGVILSGLLLATVGSWLIAKHTAGDAADLASLSVAQAALSGEADDQACATGRAIARRNRAEVTECDIVRLPDEVAVKVTVSVSAPQSIPGLPKEVVMTAYAGNPGQQSSP